MAISEKKDYFVGLDIGTNSVGWAATHTDYQLLKHKQHPMWGVHLFDSASLAEQRRTQRVARRRIDRRQQRIQLLRELFAKEIAKVDRDFFRRINDSALKKEKGAEHFAIFADRNFNDIHFYKEYPTIHHLICELMDSEEVHDVRLVYVACAWLLAHRGHFLSDVDKDNIDQIFSFKEVYSEVQTTLQQQEIDIPWGNNHMTEMECILKSSLARSEKHRRLGELLNVKKKKGDEDLLDWNEFLRLLCGLESNLQKFFGGDIEAKLSLGSDDTKIAEALATLDDEQAAVIQAMKKVYDWSVLADIVGFSKNISSAKVQNFEKHKEDLLNLKTLFRKYLPREEYKSFFVVESKENYVTYKDSGKREDFYGLLNKKLSLIKATDCQEDEELLARIKEEIVKEKFLPKQVNSDNRTIPYQLYWSELKNLLLRASSYLPFLTERDEDGLNVIDKILSIMEFRVPYFVGPLNANSKFAWFKRKAEGRILPWNIDKKVDFDASEQAFIARMLNTCTYLPSEKVVPKQSLLYQKFEVLNLINNIHIDGRPISVEDKQKIYNRFMDNRKMSKKSIFQFLKAENRLPHSGITESSISGIDETFSATLDSWQFFKPFMQTGKLNYEQVEEIISWGSFSEDKKRFSEFLKKFSTLDDLDRRCISSKKFAGFGRLSRKFLTQLLYDDPRTGNPMSIISMMWNYNLNLMQLLSEKYPFAELVAQAKKEYYSENPASSLVQRLDDMYVSNAVKRPIIRTMEVLKDITKTMGYAPKKIFVEMARDVTGEKKGQRKPSRLKDLQEKYRQISEDDRRRMEQELAKYTENDLQKDALYLYFTQLGKDMYTGEPITDFSLYNKDHIYPRSAVKDDSIQNNLVLVKSKDNGDKDASYPVDSNIRNRMMSFWTYLHDKKLINDEKFARLTRSTPFSDDEKWGFINRQLVETRQSTKVITELLKEYYPETEIVYVKANLVSDYRHEFKLLKSRTLNDLHHGKDAYLNIVVGNVYHGYFTRSWFMNHSSDYSIKTKTIFTHPRTDLAGNVLWEGARSKDAVAAVMKRNYLHLTTYTYCRHSGQNGGLFDQNPLPAGKGQIPLKKDKPIEIYGGYNGATTTFFVLALSETVAKKPKKELTLVPVDLMIAQRFLTDNNFAIEYINNFISPDGKKKFNISFPLGKKPIRIKTIFEVDDSLRFRLNGKDSGGSAVSVSLFTPMMLPTDWEQYVKRLESLTDKAKKNPNLVFSEKHDHVSAAENLQLYDMLIAKLNAGVFSKRPANPLVALQDGRERFVTLSEIEQANLLLCIMAALGSMSNTPLNLQKIGGKAAIATTRLSSNLSNWAKSYTSVCLVYTDSSGLHEQKSMNLLELLK